MALSLRRGALFLSLLSVVCAQADVCGKGAGIDVVAHHHTHQEDVVELASRSAQADFVGLIQTRAPASPKPKLYVYDMPRRFQNGGVQEGRAMIPEPWTVNGVFGGPPIQVENFSVWDTDMFVLPVALHYRFLKSPQRTYNVDEADVFLIPAYTMNFHDSCPDYHDLRDTLFMLNPKLKDNAWAKEKGPRHLLVSGTVETCHYMWAQDEPLAWASRTSIELNGYGTDGPHLYNDNKPWAWYQFPYPAMFHDAKDLPALRRRGRSRFLWGFSGRAVGQAQKLRELLTEQCEADSRCMHVQPKAHQSVGESLPECAEQKLQSIFCVEPPGDSLLRKSLLDSLLAGCIPVLFEHQALDMYEPFATAEEWAKVTVFIPEAKLTGWENRSKWVNATLHANTNLTELRKLYPEHSLLFEPQQNMEERAAVLKAMFRSRGNISSLLRAISEEEIERKRRALAEIAHRFVIAADDNSNDAVDVLLRHIAKKTG